MKLIDTDKEMCYTFARNNMSTPIITPNNSPTRFPVVEFEYPDSQTQKMKLRYLKVVEANADYIKGYELDNPLSQKDGQFKTFSRNRLVRSSPTLVIF